MVRTVRFEWCGPDAAATMHELTQLAFAPQAALDRPSGALSETVDIVRADLQAAWSVIGHLQSHAVAAARVRLHDDHLEVRRLAVHPASQRHGIATMLMTWIHGEAVALGHREIRLGVRHALPTNLAFYRHLGYEAAADHGDWAELRLWLGDVGQRRTNPSA